VEKLTLPENELLVWLTSGTSETYPLESVRKICFDASIGLAENLSQASGNLRVYPNPASKAITVTGIPAGAGAVRIFSMDGRLMASEPVTTDKATMDISRLQSGLYLLKALGLTTKLVRL
jgi:hypothetical protein